MPTLPDPASPEPRANSLFKRWNSRLQGSPYAFAFVITILGLLLRFLLDPWLRDQMPYITFVLGVAVTGLWVGVGPALLSTLLGAGIAYLCFVEPRYHWGFRGVSDFAGFSVYLAAALAVVILIRARNKAFEAAEHASAQRQEAQRSLADAQALLRAFMDNSPVCAYLKDEQGRNVYVNTTATTALKEWFSLYNEGHLSKHEQQVLQAGRPMEFVDRITHGDDARYWLAVKFPFVDQAGHKFVGANLIDITERVHSEEADRKGEQLAAAGQMASLMAHEINNPLAGVTNALFLLGKEPLTDSARHYLDMVDEQVRRVSHITRLSLSFYKEHEPPSSVDIGAILNEVVEALQPALASKNIQCASDVRGEVTLIAREDRIRDLLMNLLSNAVDFGARSVRIRLAAGTDWQDIRRTGIRMTITDDGCGIACENRARLFHPFFTTKAQRGTGLGLWASKMIVLRNGGSIRLRSSTRFGRSGTSVSVFLPTIGIDRQGVTAARFQEFAAEKLA